MAPKKKQVKNTPIKGNRAVVKLSKIKKKPGNAFSGPTISDGGFSDQFGSSKAPVLSNGVDMPILSLGGYGDSAPLIQDFPDMNLPSIPAQFPTLSDFTNNDNPPANPIPASAVVSPPINGEQDVVDTANQAIGKIPVWVWVVVIAIAIGAVIYISKKK